MKRIFTYFVAFLLILSLCLSVIAATGQYVQDHAGLLGSMDASRLSDRMERIRETHGVSVYLITLDSLGTRSAEQYADNYYDNSLSGDAVIFVISMLERQWCFRTYEKATSVVTDFEIDSIMESAVPNLTAGRYFEAFDEIISGIEAEYDSYNTTDWGLRIGIAVVVGLIAAGVTLLIMRSKMKTDKPQRGAGNYMVDGSFDLYRCHDIYLYSHTTRTARPKSNSSGGGRSGGSRGGRSGGF